MNSRGIPEDLAGPVSMPARSISGIRGTLRGLWMPSASCSWLMARRPPATPRPIFRWGGSHAGRPPSCIALEEPSHGTGGS